MVKAEDKWQWMKTCICTKGKRTKNGNPLSRCKGILSYYLIPLKDHSGPPVPAEREQPWALAHWPLNFLYRTQYRRHRKTRKGAKDKVNHLRLEGTAQQCILSLIFKIFCLFDYSHHGCDICNPKPSTGTDKTTPRRVCFPKQRTGQGYRTQEPVCSYLPCSSYAGPHESFCFLGRFCFPETWLSLLAYLSLQFGGWWFSLGLHLTDPRRVVSLFGFLPYVRTVWWHLNSLEDSLETRGQPIL